jgi:hypothetical protein
VTPAFSRLRRPTDGRYAAAADDATTIRVRLMPHDWLKPAAGSFSLLGRTAANL